MALIEQSRWEVWAVTRRPGLAMGGSGASRSTEGKVVLSCDI
jgi:hypothetical protein